MQGHHETIITKQSALNQNTKADCFIIIVLRWLCILVQSWLFHCYCLTMALYFGSKLTVALLLSDDGLVFWFSADCFIIIFWPWLCILVQSWLFHYYCLTMALYFGSKLTVSLLLSYDGLVFWFRADCFIIFVLCWPCILVFSLYDFWLHLWYLKTCLCNIKISFFSMLRR
jgi:hypothetical protein